jgi:hypothetical protein
LIESSTSSAEFFTQKARLEEFLSVLKSEKKEVALKPLKKLPSFVD